MTATRRGPSGERRARVAHLLLAFVSLAPASCGSQTSDNSPAAHLELPRSPQLAVFRVTEKRERRFMTLYTLEDAERIVRIDVLRNVDGEAARALLEDGIMGLEALYANALSPYPGDVSKEIVADERYRPRLVTKTLGGVEYSYFLLFAGERLSYGVASKDTIEFRSLLGWFHDETSRRFYKVRCFAPLTAAHAGLESLFLSLRLPTPS